MTYQSPPTPPPKKLFIGKGTQRIRGMNKDKSEEKPKTKEIALLAPDKADFKSNTVKLGKGSNWMMIRG